MAAWPGTAGPSTAAPGNAATSNDPRTRYFQFPTVWLMTASSIDPPQPPYLPDTPIHDLFSEDKFRKTTGPIVSPGRLPLTPAQYRQILPALRLASKFITNDACLAWWTTLCFSTVHTDGPTQRRYLAPLASTPARCAQVRQLLTDNAHRVRFRFVEPDTWDRDAYGRAQSQGDNFLVTLHSNHLRYIIYPNGLGAAHESRRLRFFFHLAMILVHETAHCVSRMIHGHDEPFHALDEPEIEMGSSWEHFIFNGKIQPLNGLRSAQLGLVWARWLDDQGQDDALGRRELRFWGVYMAWIESLFRELTWRKVDALGIKEIEVRTCGDRARSALDEEGYWEKRHLQQQQQQQAAG